MECWFFADREAIKSFFGNGFRENALPSAAKPLEAIGKTAALAGLKKATRDCKTKGSYGKGDHSFKLLARIDPAKVTAASPWANRFVGFLNEKMSA